MQVSGWKVGFRQRSDLVDGYTIGLFILALYIINKIIELSLTATLVVVVAGVVIAVIGGKKR